MHKVKQANSYSLLHEYASELTPIDT